VFNPTQEVREKISASQLGNTHCKGRIAWNRGKPALNRGIPHTAGAREKISAGRRGIYPSEEARAKFSAALMGNTHTLGHKLSAEHRAKISASLMGNTRGKGKPSPRKGQHPFSQESKEKMRQAQIARWAKRREEAACGSSL
jgi:hypothetical protein